MSKKNRFRTIAGIAAIGAVLVGTKYYPELVNTTPSSTTKQVQPKQEQLYQPQEVPSPKDTLSSTNYLPTTNAGKLIQHKYFALSYVEKYEVAEWVAYELTREQLKRNRVPREDNFLPDDKVTTTSADNYDYRGSGYDRGHLVPAADRSFSREAMNETFLLSNITPQERAFNGGIWRELEELVRDWAYKFNTIYIATGPVLSMPMKGEIGNNKVAVPEFFYKVILDIAEPELKGIAFIIPNDISDKPLQEFATSIDAVEKATTIDFFPNLLDEKLEAKLESTFNVQLWKFDPEKYKRRLEQWNKQ
jgi:endonuclease G